MNVVSKVSRITDQKSTSASKGFLGGRAGQVCVLVYVFKKSSRLKRSRFVCSWDKACRPSLRSGSQVCRGAKVGKTASRSLRTEARTVCRVVEQQLLSCPNQIA